MRASVVEAVAALGELAGEDVTAWSDAEVRDGLAALLTAHHQLAAVVSTVVGSFDRRDLSVDDGCRTTRTWLTAFGRMSQGAATGWLARGRLLRQFPSLAEGALAGLVSAEHLRPVQELVDEVGAGPVQPCDEVLAALSATANPADTAAACARIRSYLDPDGPEPDGDAFDRRDFALQPSGSGWRLKGRLDGEGGEVLRTAIDALLRPPTPDDLRTAGQRRADALVELARFGLEGGRLPTTGGVRPQLGILLTPDALLGPDHHHPHPTPPTPDPGPGPGPQRAGAERASTG